MQDSVLSLIGPAGSCVAAGSVLGLLGPAGSCVAAGSFLTKGEGRGLLLVLALELSYSLLDGKYHHIGNTCILYIHFLWSHLTSLLLG
jgi:hypothetical protein